MSTTIDSLDIQITTSAGGAAVNIERLANALDRLKSSSKLTSVVNNLGKLKTALDGLKDSTATINSITKLSLALGKLAPNAKALSSSISKLPSGIKKVEKATNAMATATDDSNEAFSMTSVGTMAAIHNYDALISAINQVAQALGSAIQEAMQWDGIQFRFGRTFGEDAEETYDWIVKINEELGINIQQFMQYSSLYGSLLSGFGMAQEKVTAISVGLTELSYDIWAAYNDRFKTLEDASEAIRSAITGEIEPIRNAGIALTEASLQEYIDSTHLAGVSIEKLTEAQKSEVRYAAMLNAAMNQGIVGTYAKELNTAEGVMRNMAQSIRTLVQALGSLFIPILQVAIPYVTAFVNILTDAVFAVAKFFGIEMQKIDWSNTTKGVGGLAEGAKAAASGLDSAKKAAKKLKDYTMGFDELNVIDPDSGSGAGGSGGTGAGADGWGEGLDLKKLWDESIFDMANNKIDEIRENLEGVLKVAALVGGAIAAWKIAMKAGDIKDVFGKAGVAGMVLAGNDGVADELKLLGATQLADKMKVLRGVLLKTPIGSLILGSGATSIGAAVAAVAAVVAAIAAIGAGLVLVYKNSENFREGLAAIGQGLVWLFNGLVDVIGWCGEKIGQFFGWMGGLLNFPKLDFGWGDVLIILGSLLLFTGPVALAIAGVVAAIKLIGYAAKDSLAPVDLFGEGISNATKEKVEPFIETMNELDNTLKTLDWSNAIVTDSDLADISAKLKSVTDTIIAELDSDKNEALANINPLKGMMSEEKYQELTSKVQASYDKQKQIVLDGEARINEILKAAKDEARALTDEEAKEIDRIQSEMKETGIKYLSESQTESNLILQRMKDNASQLSAEQASNVIKDALSARDETIKAAEEQYNGIALEAQRMLDTGVINKEEYDEIIKAAKGAKDDTIKAANTQYDEIVKTAKSRMGEYSKYIDEETGEIKSNWEVFCEDFSEKWEKMWKRVKEWWDEKVAPFFTKKYWVDTFSTLKDGLITSVKNGVNGAIDLMNRFIGWVNDHLKFSWDGLSIAGKEIYPGGSVQLFTIPKIQKLATGGFIEDGLFTMNHGEMAGKFSNGKSIVANNQQIVDGIAEGVYSAVVSAMNDTQRGGEQAVNVYLDGKQIYSSVKRTEARQGVNLMGNQLGYVY